MHKQTVRPTSKKKMEKIMLTHNVRPHTSSHASLFPSPNCRRRVDDVDAQRHLFRDCGHAVKPSSGLPPATCSSPLPLSPSSQLLIYPKSTITSCNMSTTSTSLPSIVIPFNRCVGGQRSQVMGTSVALPPIVQKMSRLTNLNHQQRRHSTAVICNASLNARCAAEQTATVTRQSSTITIAPVQGKEKSPDLDDGGTGLPPRDDDGDGGGGGGGGGPNWSGGFFFFGFLAFLGFLKDKEDEGPYKSQRRKH